MTHQLPLVQKQVRQGLVVTRRVTKYFRGLSALIAQYAEDAERITVPERKAESSDELGDSLLWMNTASYIQSAYQRERRFAEQITVVVVQPLEKFATTAEAKAEELTKKERAMVQQLATRGAETDKHRQSCLKLWEQLRANVLSHNEATKKKDTAEATKILQKRTALKSQVRTAFLDFDAFLQAAQRESQSYRTKWLPDLLQIGRAVQQECRDRSRMPSSA
eukprot:TRINITY_DN22877_c0_g2_i1.p1 TRINITY_DN22877_c0_g2~~TRINITY_DN22877_c0_g2_i1.p1  ORF type:complete len:236 (-),score=26.31 TRINITY_DN22877_c0_g2_i1:11-673(-)